MSVNTVGLHCLMSCCSNTRSRTVWLHHLRCSWVGPHRIASNPRLPTSSGRPEGAAVVSHHQETQHNSQDYAKCLLTQQNQALLQWWAGLPAYTNCTTHPTAHVCMCRFVHTLLLTQCTQTKNKHVCCAVFQHSGICQQSHTTTLCIEFIMAGTTAGGAAAALTRLTQSAYLPLLTAVALEEAMAGPRPAFTALA